MFNISEYLAKFKVIGQSETALKDMVIEVFKGVLNVSLERKDLKIQNGIAYVQTNPMVKNMMVIKKNTLLAEIAKKTDKVKEIR